MRKRLKVAVKTSRAKSFKFFLNALLPDLIHVHDSLDTIEGKILNYQTEGRDASQILEGLSLAATLPHAGDVFDLSILVNALDTVLFDNPSREFRFDLGPDYFRLLVSSLHLGHYLHQYLKGRGHNSLEANIIEMAFQPLCEKVFYKQIKTYHLDGVVRADSNTETGQFFGFLTPFYQIRTMINESYEAENAIKPFSSKRITLGTEYMTMVTEFIRTFLGVNKAGPQEVTVQYVLFFAEALGSLFRYYINDPIPENLNKIRLFRENVVFALRHLTPFLPHLKASVLRNYGLFLEGDRVYGEKVAAVHEFISLLEREKQRRADARHDLCTTLEIQARAGSTILSVADLGRYWYHGLFLASFNASLLGSPLRAVYREMNSYLPGFIEAIHEELQSYGDNRVFEVYDIGALDGSKGYTVANALQQYWNAVVLHIVDSSFEFVNWAEGRCRQERNLHGIQGISITHHHDIDLLDLGTKVRDIAPLHDAKQRVRLLMLMGQTLGNFEEYELILASLSANMDAGDYLLLEVDTSKDIRRWSTAFNDIALKIVHYLFAVEQQELRGYDPAIHGSGVITTYKGKIFNGSHDGFDDTLAEEVLCHSASLRPGIRRYFIPNSDSLVQANKKSYTLAGGTPIHYLTSIEFPPTELINIAKQYSLIAKKTHEDEGSLQLLVRKS